MAAMSLLALLLAVLAMAVSAQNPAGFISIDCGLDDDSGYIDQVTQIPYSPDEPYTSAGVNSKVSPSTDLTSIRRYYANVRSFPDGTRNCYTLRPLVRGAKYRVNAEFLYGNYDGLGRPPTFDLYLGVNLWVTLTTGDFSRTEIIAVAAAESMQVCLVNTGNGTPFISALELRPLPNSTYTLVNSSHSIVMLDGRSNYGGEGQIKYPADPYDRVWFPVPLGRNISTVAIVDPVDGFPVPQAVLKTAATAASLSESLNITIPGSPEDHTHLVMYFAELQQLGGNETREFKIYQGDSPFYGPVRPNFLKTLVTYTRPPGQPGGLTYSLRATANSTLPPIINALETFAMRELTLKPTDEDEVEAISKLKNLYKVKRNWDGDPCVPQNFTWEGLECSANASNYWRITSLNLSHSELGGGIPPFIANLTNLESLDLSYNNFTGEIPAYIENLSALKILNLESNNLNGTIPKTLYERSQDGSLQLRIKNNPILCSTVSLCESTTTTKKKKIIIPIAIAISASFLLLLIVTIICIRKRRRAEKTQNPTQVYINTCLKPNHTVILTLYFIAVELYREQRGGDGNRQLVGNENRLLSESDQFSTSDVVNITNNFDRPIGRGGFGTVYYGRLKDETEVAVKVLSTSSTQGAKEFRAEAQLLRRVHHKYLVSLLGYCKDNLALLYEFVPQGSLADHLSGDSANINILSWRARLRIALEAAQGLDYLHCGCKPPIVHRDVKPSNILLTNNFEVKLADFGLSRSFTNEEATHISTLIAGTPGYLDPEYYKTSRLNETSDVYSFGIVLLELVTGKPPIANDSKRTHITQYVQSRLERGDVADIADQRMCGDYDVNSIWKVIEIALSCTSPNSGDRPTISTVVVQLKDCLVVESSGDFPDYTTTDTMAILPPNSFASISPSAR
ncbi:unnamed protein product [Spirodela intermedia]|uniref:Protein kinase domain-containing protein n=1 Tax=Spirodela intermedia TaxID=51605 RepID=A0A7I8LL78_SPIIN|nr:unnamed protein product [Spirodela intermedia]